LNPNRLTDVLWYGSIALEFALCGRLLASSLWRRYPRFTAFVAVLAAESVTLAVIRPYGAAFYGHVWIVTRCLALTFEILAVIEIFSLWSRNFPGIGSFGRRLFGCILVTALLTVAATLPGDATRGGWVVAYQIVSVANRGTHLLLALFLLLMLAFFARFGAPVGPNLRRHTRSMLFFLAATSITYWVVTVGRDFRMSNLLLPAISFSCLIAWLAAFRRGGEVRVRSNVSPAEMHEYEAAEALSEKLLRFEEKITVRGLLGMK
jgi:hypothetical protein